MFTKTGTTIVGVKFDKGVILCADTRSTNGPVVADKNCSKIHFISPQIMCCGAGTAADTRRVTRMASHELQLFSYKYLKAPLISHAERLMCDYLHGYGGQIGAALVLGGIDVNGCKLYTISPNGYSAEVEFTSMGSGSLAAMGVLEMGFKRNMSREDAILLGVEAIKAGIMNDLYSGSNVDVNVIDENGVEILRNYINVESRKNNERIIYPKDSIKITKEEVFKYVEEI